MLSGAVVAQQVSIERAKRDWEGTADALAELVCLLDRSGHVLRTNRVVEDWSLGTVAGVLGRQAHSVLHPKCRSSTCSLAMFLRQAIGEIAGGGTAQFEFRKVLSGRHLYITVRPLRARVGGAATGKEPLAVLVAADITALDKAQEALKRLNADLEWRVTARTQALADTNRDLRNEVVRREAAEVALRASRNEMVALSEQLIHAQEGERKRIAIELHDSVGQSLSAVKYTLERSLKILGSPHLGDAQAVVELALRRIQETAEGIRTISMNLRPKILDDLGAASAVQWFCRDFSDSYPLIAVRMDLAVRDQQVPDRLATVVYRCVQELLNNVATHSGARNVVVQLAREGAVLTLSVRDDGVGMEGARAESRRHGMGLRNLRERAQMTGGKFSCSSAPGSGTLAQLAWQLKPDE
jgi:signal transduction histidine kinase